MPSTKKGTKDFTASERSKILARAQEIGLIDAADEYGTSWQAVAAWQRDARGKGELPEAPASPKPKLKKGKRLHRKKTTLDSSIKLKGKRKGRTAKEIIKTVEKRTLEVKAPEADEVKKTRKPEPPKGNASLEFENALLKDRVEELKKQVERLRTAIVHLA